MENGTDTSFNWTLDASLSGPAISFFIALLFFLALPTNLFIIGHALYHRKTSLKKSAIILLFSLAVTNLLMTIFYMPFAIIASAAEEWIFGDTDNTRNILCQMHGFVFEYSSTMTGHILVVISIDRFLFIVRSMDYHKIMTWKVTCVIIAVIAVSYYIQINIITSAILLFIKNMTYPYGPLIDLQFLILIWCCSPFYGSGLGFYDWSFTSGGCQPFILDQSLPVTIIYLVYTLLSFLVILVTTVWTFCFTHGFLRKRMKIRKEARNSGTEKHIYLSKVRNLVGMFGVLLLANAFSWIPYFASVFYSSVDELEQVPKKLDVFLFVMALSNNAMNPLIQIFFRKDLHDSLSHIYQKAKSKLQIRVRERIPNGPSSPNKQMRSLDTTTSIV